MNTQSNTVKGGKIPFIKGYEQLPAGKQTDFRKELMKICGWKTPVTFHNKKRGVHKISPLEYTAIENKFAEFNINPWSGTYLK